MTKKIISLSILLLTMVNNYLNATQIPITIAILAKDKAHCLDFYLYCIEQQTWPKKDTYIYIRTNNNTDNTRQILHAWVEKVKNNYKAIYIDDTDISDYQQHGQHEWTYDRFKLLGAIRNNSIKWALQHNSHYFVVDCDNFILPHTLETLVKTDLPIVAPLLHSSTNYSNYHAQIDTNGYFEKSPYYLAFLQQEIKGLIQLPVVHCTYFVHKHALSQLTYDDESGRYEYVIFSDSARKHNIMQYLDTREIYGYITFAETGAQLIAEPWFANFSHRLFKLPASQPNQ